MDNASVDLIMFLVVAGFISAFVDSVVGGGGLISLPALLLTGIPPVTALGSNKMASVMGSLTSSLSFLHSGKIDLSIIKYLFPLSLAGSACGVWAVKQIPPHFLKPLVVIMLFSVAIYTWFKKDFGQNSTYSGLDTKKSALCALMALAIGFYDGFFGPGAGSFFLFGFLLLGFDFVMAAGNARALNFASNLAAVATFGLSGLIYFPYAIPMGLSMMVGAWCGSNLAIRKGAAYVRPLFFLMTSLLIGKQLWDLI